MIDKRPSGASMSKAELSTLSNSSNSALMKIRIAWKLRVAGCLCLSLKGTACEISSAN